jgi:hypothetical protein
MSDHSAVQYPNGDWCGAPLHQFQNHVLMFRKGIVPIDRVQALAKKHGACCFHSPDFRRLEYEVHFYKNAAGRKAATAFNREWIAAWNDVVKHLAPPPAGPVSSQSQGVAHGPSAVG